MTRLYLATLPSATADTSGAGVGSNVSQLGLLEDAGTAVTNVSTSNVDLSITGRFQYGPVLSTKFADELDSLSESAITGLPLFDPVDGSIGRSRGYYEVEEANVDPAHPADDSVYEYDVSLVKSGTTRDKVRRVTTSPAPIQTALTGGVSPRVGVPAAARGVRWYSGANGSTPATAASTVTTEFGDVDLYDPDDSPFDDAALTYELALPEEGRVDTRVYDTRGRDKLATTAGGDEVNVWVHAYHPAFEFDGPAVLDNGLRRLRLDPAAGTVDSSAYDTGSEEWVDEGLNASPELVSFDMRRIRPTDVRAKLYFNVNGDTRSVVVALQRGVPGVIVRQPSDDVIVTAIRDLFDPIAEPIETDLAPSQDLKTRSEVE